MITRTTDGVVFTTNKRYSELEKLYKQVEKDVLELSPSLVCF
jgi:hypothetical protein